MFVSRLTTKTSPRLRAALCFFVGVLSGCQALSPNKIVGEHTLLKPAHASPDSVTMQIVWARFPVGDPALNDEAWREIDETTIEPAVRSELANNGFRVGIVGGSPPAAIAHVLQEGTTKGDQESADPTTKSLELSTDPIVHGRVRQLRRDQRSEIQASETFASLPLLVNGSRELSGRTYEQAQAIYALRVDPQPDRAVQVELTPELHHGDPRLRWTGGDEGILRQASLREREVFEKMRMRVKLVPGQMLVLMSLPDAGSRLAHWFHTVNSVDGPQQKLILIRLADVPPSDTFVSVIQ
jgi:hypothetical protein